MNKLLILILLGVCGYLTYENYKLRTKQEFIERVLNNVDLSVRSLDVQFLSLDKKLKTYQDKTEQFMESQAKFDKSVTERVFSGFGSVK